jgi:hypothetical protein
MPIVEPPCETCRPADLRDENVVAMQVYDRCADEWITNSADGSIQALPAAAIREAMDITGVQESERQIVFDRVKMLGRVVAKEARKEAGRHREEAKQ